MTKVRMTDLGQVERVTTMNASQELAQPEITPVSTRLIVVSDNCWRNLEPVRKMLILIAV